MVESYVEFTDSLYGKWDSVCPGSLHVDGATSYTRCDDLSNDL